MKVGYLQCAFVMTVGLFVGCISDRPTTVRPTIVQTEVGEFVELPGRGVYIARTEVVQSLWKDVMGNNPSCHQGDDYPVENITVQECKDFISRLNGKTGRRFRLPTDAEWEYALCAGSESCSFDGIGTCCSGKDGSLRGIDEYCWYAGNSDKHTHPVAQKLPNPWGLYDMLGNVWEWTEDNDITGNRGGCYASIPDEISTFARYTNQPVHRGFLGFRLVMEK